MLTRLIKYLPATLLVAVCGPAAHGGMIANELGQAGPSYFSVLSFGGPNQVSGSAMIQGNIGVVGAGLYHEYANSQVTGAVELGTQATSQFDTGSVLGGGVISNQAFLAQAMLDAQSASSHFAALSPTQTVPGGAITASMTIVGAPGLNVINVTGIDLSTGVLLLTGPPGAQFVINNSGVFLLQGTGVSIRVSPGISPYDVVVNQTSNAKVQASGIGNSGNIILLAPTAHIQLDGSAWTGELIDGIGFAAESGQILTSQISSADPPAQTPEPATFCLTALGLALGFVLRKLKTNA